MDKIKLGISTCLWAKMSAMTAANRLDRFLTDTLGQYVEYRPVCPEVNAASASRGNPCGWWETRLPEPL